MFVPYFHHKQIEFQTDLISLKASHHNIYSHASADSARDKRIFIIPVFTVFFIFVIALGMLLLQLIITFPYSYSK